MTQQVREAVLQMFEALQSRAANSGFTLRKPPPEPTTCCGRGCNGCVWEGFYAAAQYWEEDALLALADCTDTLPKPLL